MDVGDVSQFGRPNHYTDSSGAGGLHERLDLLLLLTLVSEWYFIFRLVYCTNDL